MGARRRDIFLGFLFESLAITLGGGTIGIGVAWLLTQLARLLPIPDGAEPHISLATAGGAVSLLVVVGLIAGVGPARRAAAVYPVEALRAEQPRAIFDYAVGHAFPDHRPRGSSAAGAAAGPPL